jgi:hypothetical protein
MCSHHQTWYTRLSDSRLVSWPYGSRGPCVCPSGSCFSSYPCPQLLEAYFTSRWRIMDALRGRSTSSRRYTTGGLGRKQFLINLDQITEQIQPRLPLYSVRNHLFVSTIRDVRAATRYGLGAQLCQFNLPCQHQPDSTDLISYSTLAE